MKSPFINGWFIWAMSIVILCAVATYGNTTGDNPLPASMWWWVVLIFAIVFGARSYQFWIQHR